uniref:Uncharacterized protein n=1 Tax=Oryza sativa subsp. japonica TaxID=39947 RepID=Q84YM4_ORYSJ|nr:hypothetical protein [Oryza sativa Japonica Group]
MAEVANVGTKLSINNNEDTSRRRRKRSMVKAKMPTNGGIIGQPCEDTSRRRQRQAGGDDVDAHQQRHNRPAVKAKAPVGGRRGGRSVKTWMPKNGGVTNQSYRRGHQSAATEASRVGGDTSRRRWRQAGGEVVVDISNGGGEDKPAEWTRGRLTGKLRCLESMTNIVRLSSAA